MIDEKEKNREKTEKQIESVSPESSVQDDDNKEERISKPTTAGNENDKEGSPSSDAVSEGIGQLIGQSFGMPSQKTNHPKTQRQLTARQKRQVERMRNNPEMIQARKELQDEFLAAHPHYADMTDEELRKSMMEHSIEEERLRKQKLRNHIETFSDGMIAIIITIMLLEIPVPSAHVSYYQFASSIAVFLISFVVTANFWFNRHKIFALTEEITEGIIVQDFIFTGLLSLIPLLTKWIMVNPTSFSSLNYGVVLVLILLQQEWLSYSITKDHFKRMPKSFKFWKKIWGARLAFTLLINIAITVIAIISPHYGHWLFVAVPIFYFIFRMANEKESEASLEEALDTGKRAVGVPYLK